MPTAADVLAGLPDGLHRPLYVQARVRRLGDAAEHEFTDALRMFDGARGRTGGVGRTLSEAAKARMRAVLPVLLALGETVRDLAECAEGDVAEAAKQRCRELETTLELLAQAQAVTLLPND